MLIGLHSCWKYPVGYVLIDSMEASNLHCLLSKAIQLAYDHDLNVYSITMDRPRANLSAMKLFGCKLGNSVGDINGRLSFGNYEHSLYFIPAPCHMLKLGRR